MKILPSLTSVRLKCCFLLDRPTDRSDDLIFRRAHDEMHRHAQRIFHVTPRTLDVVGPQFTSEERDERVARRVGGWHTEESPEQVIDGFRGCLGAAGHHHPREIEPGRMTRCRNQLAGRLLPTNVARDASVELLVPLELSARVATWIPSPVMGDMQVEIRYTEFKDVGNGAKFPFHIHMHQGDHPFLGGRNLMDLAISNAVVNVANAAQAVPDAVRTAKPPVVNVTTMQLAPGVWLLGGGSHNSVAVEFRDYITVIEGPLDDDRSNAVIAAAKRVIPNKPIRYLVNTHHHWDHSGGIRAFAAEGATIVTQESNKDFYERIVLAPQPRSLSPDRLSKFPFATTGPGPQKLETFAERHAISDGTQTVISYHVEERNHARDIANDDI